MLMLVTGLPGSYKTTWTLRELCRDGFADRRKFAHGVNGLHVDGIEVIDADRVREWESALPGGAVIIVDEAQKLFPARGMHAGAPPKWIERLAEHRHGGYDFILITQHPTFVDAFVRKLVGRHVHLTRRFGLDRATVYSWEEVQTPEDKSAKSLAVTEVFKPEALDYARHESATQHTHKRRLPWKKFFVLGAAAAVVVASVSYLVVHLRHGIVPEKTAPAPQPGEPVPPARLVGGAFWNPHYRSARPEHLERAESAPLYDNLQVVKDQPRVSGCADFGVPLGGKPACYCTTDQGSIVDGVSVHECRALIRRGWFDETGKRLERAAQQIARLDAHDKASSGHEPAAPPEGGGPQAAPPGDAPLSASADVK